MDPIYRITLPFRDIDMHGHMHNAAYVSHFEAALSHFLRAQGLQDHFSPDGGSVFLVRKIEVTYEAPCRYDEEINVTVRLARIGGSSLTFAPVMAGADGAGRALAEIVWIYVDKASGRPVQISADLRAALEGLAPC